MRFVLRVAAVLIATTVGLSAGESWIEVPGARPGVRFEVDAESVIARDNRVEFWERVEYANPTIKDEASLRMIKVKKVLRVMDCKERTQGLREAMAFSSDARLIEHVMLGGAGVRMSPVPDGTIAAWQLDWACKLANGAR